MDWKFYALLYPDLRLHGVLGPVASLQHFREWGRREGRYPNPGTFLPHYGFSPSLQPFLEGWAVWGVFDIGVYVQTSPECRGSTDDQVVRRYVARGGNYGDRVGGRLPTRSRTRGPGAGSSGLISYRHGHV